MMLDLTDVQQEALRELRAACDESSRLWPIAGGWTRTGLISGTREARSARTLRSLMALGLVEGEKPRGCAQTQWSWRITAAGREALAPASEPVRQRAATPRPSSPQKGLKHG